MGLTGRAPVRTEDTYGTSLFTRRRRASLRDGGAGRLLPGQRRDEPPYADYGRRLRDEPPYPMGYGPEALTGRASLRTEWADPPCAEALTDEPPHPHGLEALTGRASLRRRFTGRASLRYRPKLRASIRDGPLPHDFVLAPRKPPLSSFAVKGPVSP